MRKNHPAVELPDRKEVIWRYLDFPKFVSFLQSRSLYFSRSDLLGDPLEGSVTRGMSEEWKDHPQVSNLLKKFAGAAFVNCWHLGAHESMAMWRGYGGTHAVAIQSTFGALDEAVPAVAPDGFEIYIGAIRYIDHSSTVSRMKLEHLNAFEPFMYKNVVYAHENELRAIFLNHHLDSKRPPGYSIPSDLSKLVIGVVISPLAPDWFYKVVSDLVKKYEFDFPVTISGVPTSGIY